MRCRTAARIIDFKVSEANHWANESFEIKLRNRKKQPAEIRVVDWDGEEFDPENGADRIAALNIVKAAIDRMN